MFAQKTYHFGWLLALAGAAALTWWLNNLVVPLPPLPERESRHDPDYTMERFTITDMNAEGFINYRLRADRMDHFPDDGSTRLVKPDLLFYSPQRAPYTLTATEGVATAGNEEIHLNGAVVIERPADGPRAWMRVTTRDVVVRPDQESAETLAHVLVQDPLFTAQADGMRMFVREERLQLLSRVQSTYAPRPAQ